MWAPAERRGAAGAAAATLPVPHGDGSFELALATLVACCCPSAQHRACRQHSAVRWPLPRRPRRAEPNAAPAAPGADTSQASLAPHAAAGGDGVLATHIARVRALACPPADAASWVHCEELQDELKAALAGWRSWPEDACCDESVRALSLLLAAVDAAPVWLEVFFPTQDRDEWDTRLLGPAVLPAGGRKRRLNHELHAEMWGGEYVRGPGNNDSARVQPDDLLKWIGAAYWESFPAKVERGSELEYEMRCQSYVLFCRMGIALNQPHNAAALEARLHQLRSPLTVEALRHVIHQQKCFLATQMFKHPQERQHQALQMVATTSVWEYMLRLRPTSLRTLAICASTFMDLNMPDAALRLALMGLRLAVAHTGRQGEEQPGQPGEQQGEQPGAPGQHEEQQGQEQPGQQCQGLDEPYHHALLHLVAAHAIVTGGGGGRSFPVAELQPHLKGSRAAKAACRAWLPTALRAALQGAQLALPLTEQEVAAAVQARRTTLPVQLPQPPLGVLLAQGFAPPPPRHRAGGQGGHGSGACDCPVCRSSASTRCAGCNNVVSELRKCSQCRAVGYCSKECQSETGGGSGLQREEGTVCFVLHS